MPGRLEHTDVFHDDSGDVTGAPVAADAGFFLSHSGDPGDLHSFPTRRSSDLCWIPARGGSRRLSPLSGTVPRTPAWRRRGISRSEEHTSELQSHSDLVCRLLLEKKKKTPCRSRSRRYGR